MKPVNLNTAPCSPVSSNCVIWQGPNIPCINLCNGDTVSDVVFALATELCGVLDTLDVANYDLTCFGITACGPNDFQALIQFLIEQICALQGITPVPDKSTGCPDCLVTVAPCFVVGNQTTMQLVDYVQMIAARICSIIDQLAIINATLLSLDIRVTTLENAPIPTFTIPAYPIGCEIGTLSFPGTYGIDVILEAFTNEVWCPFYDATGTAPEILAAVAAECISGTDPSRANPGVQMQVAYPSWNPTSNTLASTINHIWIALCDLYNATIDITTVDTNTVNLNYAGGILQANVQDTGWHNLLGFSYMSGSAPPPQCRRIGNEIIFRGVIQIPMGDSLDGAGGTALTVTYPDAFSGVGYGKVLDVDTSASPDACLMYSSGVPVVPSTDPAVNKNEGVSIFFRQGLRVIPTSVLPVTVNLDNAYTFGNRQFVNRSINLGGPAVYLAAHVGVAVTSTGLLYVSAPYSVENYNGTGLQDSSILRSVVSNIISGENVPLYTNTAPSNSNAPAPPPAAYNADITGSSSVWPFSMNCNNAYEMGGFTVRIDGLRGYIDPCGTLIATPPPC